MVEANWENGQIIFTPLNLYLEYILLGYDKFLKEHIKDLNLTYGELSYIFNIYYYQPISQKDLADKMYVSEANITKIVKKLEKKEYVTRIVDSNNKSRKLLSLSDEGERIFHIILKYSNEWEQKVTDSLNYKEIETFKHLAYRLSENSADI